MLFRSPPPADPVLSAWVDAVSTPEPPPAEPVLSAWVDAVSVPEPPPAEPVESAAVLVVSTPEPPPADPVLSAWVDAVSTPEPPPAEPVLSAWVDAVSWPVAAGPLPVEPFVAVLSLAVPAPSFGADPLLPACDCAVPGVPVVSFPTPVALPPEVPVCG